MHYFTGLQEPTLLIDILACLHVSEKGHTVLDLTQTPKSSHADMLTCVYTGSDS